ncbi:hypothetical protein [Pseudoalteromonas viridis]|uniref:Uncharacterized protein n=1 Tax=Pseudoalteromonas viridis TaxID=339617 RepID=A0ABX7V9M7_9GAMM|nr:hypothetical protein [Pseudoalteromonas viridis]QTL37611.1 hypothetical protein J5X90_22485 [Pseudoalteromonas viridis]
MNFAKQLWRHEHTVMRALLLLIVVTFLTLVVIHYHEWKHRPDALYLSNQAYLHHVEVQALDDLFYLAEINGLLKVVESSQVGVSFIAEFKVDVGNMIATVTHYLQQGINLNLASLVAVEILSLLSEAAHVIVMPLLVVTLSGATIWLCAELFGLPVVLCAVLKRVCEGLLLAFVLLHLMLPYAIHISGAISHSVSASYKTTGRTALLQYHQDVTHGQNKASLKDKAESSIHELEKVSPRHVRYQQNALSHYLVSTLAVNLFDLILMPLLLIWGFYRIVKGLYLHAQETYRIAKSGESETIKGP